MVFIWRIGGYGMSIGRLRQITYIGLIIFSITMWYFLITNPITTITTIFSGSVITGMILKYMERNRNV